MNRWSGVGWLARGVALVVCSALLWGVPARAHLIAAQKGTLNVVGDAAFLVLSVPVSAFQGVDDDGDMALSKAELQTHGDAIRTQLLAGVQVRGPKGALPLQLVMVDVAPSDHTPEAAASQLTVLGRFQLRPATTQGQDVPIDAAQGLSLRFGLFGSNRSEQQQDVTITRDKDVQQLRFTPERTTQPLLHSWPALVKASVQTGVMQVFSGAGPGLLLLVVMALLAAVSMWLARRALQGR